MDWTLGFDSIGTLEAIRDDPRRAANGAGEGRDPRREQDGHANRSKGRAVQGSIIQHSP
jgi:hypothetical protein